MSPTPVPSAAAAYLPPLKSSVPGCELPAVPSALGANCLALLYQYEYSQWWTPDELLRQQLDQARRLLRHARDTVPWYQARLPDWDLSLPLEATRWRQLPIISRADLQRHAPEFHSAAPPADHGRAIRFQSSGSTGQPVRGTTSDAANLYSHVAILRDHLWHRRDLAGKLAAIRPDARREQLPDWGAPVNAVFETGPLVTLDIHTPMHEQVAWLIDEAPDYLISYPSVIGGLARLCLDRGIAIPSLRQVRSFGEVVPEDLADLVRQAWQADLVDAYSARETGTLALQCPQHGGFHVQSESCLVEVLRADGEPCEPGEQGRVVVTRLHNFFMPLIRYALGDFAEVGEPCPCGRGLPVLRRVVGRARDLLTLPDGSRHAVTIHASRYFASMGVLQLQVEQDRPDHLLVRLVTRDPLNTEQEQYLREEFQRNLHFPHAIDLQRVTGIARAPGGKYFDFVSRLDP